MAGRLLVVLFDGGGNVPPVLALSRRLVSRGHEVEVLGTSRLRARVEECGARFWGFKRATSWAPTPHRSIEDDAITFAMHLLGNDLAQDVLELVERRSPDAIVVDCMVGAALCAAEHANMPTAALVHLRHGYLTEESGATTWEPALGLLNQTRAELRLDPLEQASGWWGDLWDRASLVLVAYPPELESKGYELPANAVHVGPLLDEAYPPLDDRVARWITEGDAPLVLVSLSSTYMHQEEALQRSLDALRRAGLRALVTLGYEITAEGLRAPPNTLVIDWIPHGSFLSHIDAVVTHAGMGTVLVALSRGLPLVCVPAGRDQPGNAARVVELGAGVSLGADASDEEIGMALAEVLFSDHYRIAARGVARSIRSLGTGEAAVERLERLAAQPRHPDVPVSN